jgi:hypothetical protein
MGSKPKAKSKAPRKTGAPLPIEADERHQDEVDAFVSRNRDALNESIRRSRQEIGEGVYSKRTIDELIADGRRRNRSRS